MSGVRGIKGALARFMGLHRMALVVGTAVLSIAASRIAESAKEAQDWSVLVAGAALIAWSDLARDLNERAQRLSASSETPTSRTRRDVAAAAPGIGFVVTPIIFVVGIVIAVVTR